jgi:hypothetical protein
LLVGCADSHQIIRAPGSSQSLSSGSTGYVAIPADGRYGKTTYSGSGAITAQIIAAAFAPYLSKLTVGERVEDRNSARTAAKREGATYLLFPEILQWEDRATEWSSKPDIADVKLSVISVGTGEVIDSAVISGKSGLATFGGDRPEHLLPKPMSDYAATLFRR